MEGLFPRTSRSVQVRVPAQRVETEDGEIEAKTMKRILLLGVALLWCGLAWATGVKTLKGTVKCDGEGVAAVIVTDGENFTQTDAKGRFELESADDNELIYITIPSNYRVASQQSVPQFWQKKEQILQAVYLRQVNGEPRLKHCQKVYLMPQQPCCTPPRHERAL